MGTPTKPKIDSAEVAAEVFRRDTAELLTEYAKESGMTRSELARQLDTTGGSVTRFLAGDANLQLATVARIAYALGYQPVLSLEPLNED